MHRIGDRIAQRYMGNARGSNSVAIDVGGATNHKRKLDSDGFAIPKHRRSIANSSGNDNRYRPISETKKQSHLRDDEYVSSPSRRSTNHLTHDDSVDLFDLYDEDYDNETTIGETSAAAVKDEIVSGNLSQSLLSGNCKSDDELRTVEDDDEPYNESSSSQHHRRYFAEIDGAGKAPTDRPQVMTNMVIASTERPKISETVSGGDTSNGNVLDEEDDEGVNWARVMRDYTKNTRRDRTELAWCMRPTIVADECVDIGDSYARSCWSLLYHLDDNACAASFGVNELEKLRLVTTLSKVREYLKSICRCAAYCGIDPQFTIPQEDRDVESGGTVNDDDSSNPSMWTSTKWISIARDDPEKAARSLVQLLMLLDYEVRKLCRLPCAGSMMRENLDARSINFASVNAPFSVEHAKYLKLRIECTGYYDSKVNGKTNTRMGLKGSFLISLRNLDSSSFRNNNKLNYPTWSDLDGSLNRTIEEFTRETMMIKASVRVFLNVSMRKDTRHYRVLRSVAPTDGVLAMVDLAHATYDSSKRIVAVKAYITCTMSSANSLPK